MVSALNGDCYEVTEALDCFIRACHGETIDSTASTTSREPLLMKLSFTFAVLRKGISTNRREYDCMTDLIVKSAIKDQLADQNVSADFYDALDSEVADLLEKAARRANDNDRKTVQPRDL